MSNDDIAAQPASDGGMEPEYDFSRGVRGKHFQAYRSGYMIRVRKSDGTIEERESALPEGVVVLDPDVRAYFPDSETVNRTLRGLIDLLPRRTA